MRTAAWMLALVALVAALGACAAAVIGAEAATDPALLQSGAKAYSAAAARASLHAGARATHQRFHSTLARAGVSHPARPSRGRQDHSGVNAQQVMMEVVEKVLADREAKEAETKNWEDGRDARINSWRSFQKGGVKSKIGRLKVPKMHKEDEGQSFVRRPVAHQSSEK